MALTKFEKDMVIIQKLDDEPNDVGGLTSAELKAKFDEGGEAIKKYINETLTAELDSGFSGKVPTSTTINGKPLTGNVTITKADVGLGQADNTPDLQKPLSTQQKAYIDKVAADFMIGQFPSPLQIGQGGTGSKTAQEALAALGAGVRPNLLDNACFVGGGTGWGAFPVNQTGKTSYGAGHAFDRWNINGGTCTLKPSGVSWTAGFVLDQMMDGLNLADGKARTVSYVDENHRGFSGVLTASYTAIGNYSFTYDTGTSLYMLGHTDAPAIAWVKLEEGENQTLYAENGDGTVTVLPQGLDYGQELAKCQAYLQSFGIYDAFVCVGAADSYTDFQVPLSVPFRAQPVVLENGGIEGLSIGWYNKGNVLRLRILNRKGTVGEVITFSSPCFLSAD